MFVDAIRVRRPDSRSECTAASCLGDELPVNWLRQANLRSVVREHRADAPQAYLELDRPKPRAVLRLPDLDEEKIPRSKETD